MPIRLLFLGDSITGWSDLSKYLKFSHIVECMIEAKWGADHALILNRGKGGNTTAHILERLQRDVLDAKPDAVVLLIGGNDAGIKMPREATADNLHRILTQLRAVCPRVLLLQYHLLIRADCPDKAWSHLDKNNDLIAAAAQRHGLPLLDMSVPMRDAVDDTVRADEPDFRALPTWQGSARHRTSDLVAPDGVHLLPGGELVFARAVFARLDDLGWLDAKPR